VHEYSIVAAVIAQVDEQVVKHDAASVTLVRIRVGDLAGVEVVLLERAWDLFKEGTSCADARLDIRGEPARWTCRACEAPIETGAPLRCPSCGGVARLAAGDSLVLERIELEVGEDV
jgi:hydrogenase nickel incorporation protein HypA/HybF